MKFPWCLLGASTLPRPPEQTTLDTTPLYGNAKTGGHAACEESEKHRAQMVNLDYNDSGSGDANMDHLAMDSSQWRCREHDGSSKNEVNARIPLNNDVPNKVDENILIYNENKNENTMKDPKKVKNGTNLSGVCLRVNSNEPLKMSFFQFSNALKNASALLGNLCLVLILAIAFTTQLTGALPPSSVGYGPPRRITGIERRIPGTARAGLHPGNRISEAGHGGTGLVHGGGRLGQPGAESGHGGPENARTSCDLIMGNAAARAGAAAQVLEAEVATSPQGENKYTAALTVKRVLRRYRGPGRLKKQDVITLTLQRRPQYPCVAVASLEVGKRYFVFLDAPSRRNVAPKAIAAPVPYSRRARRLIRQEVCNKCGDRRPPSPVSRLPKSDSAVRGHSVNFTCVFEGSPLPSITWYKDDVPIVLDKGSPSSPRDVRISENDVATSDDSSSLASGNINTNTMTITQRRVKSRRLIRRRRRRRRRRQSGLHSRFPGSPRQPPVGLDRHDGRMADDRPSQRWRHRARWRHWYKQKHRRRYQEVQNGDDYEDQDEVQREKRDANVLRASGDSRRLFDDDLESHSSFNKNGPRIHRESRLRLSKTSFLGPVTRNENKTEGSRESLVIRQDSGSRPLRLRSFGRDARLSHRFSGTLGNDIGESSISSRGTFRNLLSLKTGGEIREPRDSLGGRSTAKKRRQKKRKKNKNRSPSDINDVLYSDSEGSLENDIHADPTPRLRNSRRRIRPPQRDLQHKSYPEDNDLDTSHHHNDHQHPQSKPVDHLKIRHHLQREAMENQREILNLPVSDDHDDDHPRLFQVSRTGGSSLATPSISLNETMAVASGMPGLRPRGTPHRRPSHPGRPTQNRQNAGAHPPAMNRTRHGNRQTRRRNDGQPLFRNNSSSSRHPTQSMRARRPLGGRFLANRRGGGKSSRGTRRIVSSLSIGVVEEDHAGVYKCVATAKKGTAEQQVQLSVIPPLDPGLVYPCPYDSFCLNGGTCMFFKFVGELVCQCVEGFKGQRCQEKEVYPTYKFRPRLVLGARRRRPRGGK